jgi:DNA-binding NarL/FixJ family response regulator
MLPYGHPADLDLKMRRIYLCDDAPDYRRLLREVLAGEADLEVVGEGCNGRECLDEAPAHHPDVILLDVSMPVMDGFEALPALRESLPAAEVLVLSTGAAPDFEDRAIELGATGYLQKPMNVFDLPGAMRAKVAALDRRSRPRAA